MDAVVAQVHGPGFEFFHRFALLLTQKGESAAEAVQGTWGQIHAGEGCSDDMVVGTRVGVGLSGKAGHGETAGFGDAHFCLGEERVG